MANEGRVLKTFFKYEFDKNSANEIINYNERIKKSVEAASKAPNEDARRKAEIEALVLAEKRLKVIEEQSAALKEQAVLLRRESAVMRNVAEDIEAIAKPLLLIGGGIFVGLFGLAQKYVSTTKDINATTERWQQNQLKIQRAQDKIGRVAAETLLPYYERLADLAGKIASYIERNPEVAEGALKVGAITLAIGTIGMAVSKGIKFFAGEKVEDAANKMLLAARLMNGAADKELQAAGLEGATSGIGKTLGAVTLYATSLILGGNIGLAIGNAINKLIDPKAEDTTFKDIGNEFKQLVAVFAGGLGAITTPFFYLQKNENAAREKALIWFEKTARALGLLADNAEGAADSLAGGSALENSPARDQILDAYVKMQEAEKDIIQRYAEQRMAIIEKEKAAESELSATHLGNVAGINSGASRQLASASASFRAANIKAEENYAIERARIIRDGGEEIRKIEEESQKQLEKMREEHGERLVDLVASRDALGIVKENRAFARQRAEEIRNTNDEIKQRRPDLAQRLQDQNVAFQKEREQRILDYKARVGEINANRREQLKAEQEHYNAELKKLREANAKELAENDKAKAKELSNKRLAFIASVRQLDASLLGEQNLKKRYYGLYMSDLEAFLSNYRSQLNSIGGSGSSNTGTTGTYVPYVGTFAGGGYASGIIKTGEEGIEYVMSHRLTKLAESVLGRGVSEQSLAALFSNARNQITVNDNSRWNASIPANDRRTRQREFRDMLLGVIK